MHRNVAAASGPSQDLAGASMCHLRTVTGTTAVSPVPAAQPPSWARDSYLMEIKFFAKDAAKLISEGASPAGDLPGYSHLKTGVSYKPKCPLGCLIPNPGCPHSHSSPNPDQEVVSPNPDQEVVRCLLLEGVKQRLEDHLIQDVVKQSSCSGRDWT